MTTPIEKIIDKVWYGAIPRKKLCNDAAEEYTKLKDGLAQLTTDNTRLRCDYATAIERNNALEADADALYQELYKHIYTYAHTHLQYKASKALDAHWYLTHPSPKDRDASETEAK
jgi:uncharacterized protein Yka (UPF0111/DUF47 family)